LKDFLKRLNKPIIHATQRRFKHSEHKNI
jgi:hypothetical protein